VLILLCGASLAYGIRLSRTGGVGDLLSKPERMLYPYDLDTRQTPAASDPAMLAPEAIGAYHLTELGAPGPFVAGLGLTDGLPAPPFEARYQSGDAPAHLVVIHCDSPADAKERLAVLRERLVHAEGVKTYRAELYGPRAYVKYRYGGWETGPHGLAWSNGPWLFFVYAETGDALDAVAGEFPY
jgi:hypothetical protein